MRISLQEIHSGKDHAGSADTALRTTMRKERLLDGVKPMVRKKFAIERYIEASHSFNRANFGAIRLQRGNEAAVHQQAVEFD